jgi:transcriptional activator of cad operon
MGRTTATMLRIGDWCVNPTSGQISRGEETARLEARTIRLLLCLAEHAGEVVSIDDLLNNVWSDVTVSPDSVYQAVASLRRLLGDDPKQPTYVATVPRLGYRMIATVTPWIDQRPDQAIPRTSSPPAADSRQPAAENAPKPGRRLGAGLKWTAGVAALCLAIIIVLAFQFDFRFPRKGANAGHSASAAVVSLPQKSIAVLPFLDLTEGMHEEEFADGMTEELIDRFSKIPGLQVPAPTSSFYFKGKSIPVADIARTLGVAYVLDGSVRKSGARLRVAARLIQADNGYVVWSETYDRPFDDILMVQDDIAGEVTKALKASIEARTAHDKAQ